MARVIDDPSLERPPVVKTGHERAVHRPRSTTFLSAVMEIPRVS